MNEKKTVNEWMGRYRAGLERLYGTREQEIKIQYERYSDLLSEFRKYFRTDQARFFSAPGRTEIGGNHTDHNHGHVLAGAVNLDNVAVCSVNDSNMANIISTGYPVISIDLSELQPVKQEQFTSAALIRGIAARMKALGYKTGGFNAVIDGRVPKGSGLSSSASYEVLIGTIFNHLFNDGKIAALEIAMIGQYSENHYFGKPCGLMDQTACSTGGLITIDFNDPACPLVKKVHFDFMSTGYSLVITDTGGNHADLNHEYASLPIEMKMVAQNLGASVLRQVSLEELLESMPGLRSKTGDRALLRAFHFLGDSQRVLRQVGALENKDFSTFLSLVVESGYSSFMYNQNIYPVNNVKEQGLSLGLALSEMVLKGRGAWRVHGGGFAGTIQAFVPDDLLQKYVSTLEHVFGANTSHQMFIREMGAVEVEPVY